MVRSALMRPDGEEHPFTHKQVLPARETAIFNELGKAVTMAAEPWLRRALGREVLADTSGLRFTSLREKTEEHATVDWLISLTGTINERLLLRMDKAKLQYFADEDDPEARRALTILITRWAELWFTTVAELVGWQVRIQTAEFEDVLHGYDEVFAGTEEDILAVLTCGWTFADGGVVLLECWLPVNFVHQVAVALETNGYRQQRTRPEALRESVVRTYRRTGPDPSGYAPVLPVRFSALQEAATDHPGSGIELVEDVYLDVAAVLANTELRIGQLLELRAGDVLELGKTVGEPMELSLNNHNIARGEVLVLDDQLGIRISEVISVQDRLAKAQDSSVGIND
ncbi:MAG: hypothetical protein GX316_10595 [Firmicutes bacterium]|nr:hypothetical protein [Bacillota bacterium]